MINKYVKFDDKYKILKKYYDEHGHINIKQAEKYNGYPIGKWLAHFRDTYKGKGNCCPLTEEQIKMLDDLGMIWDNVKKINSENLFNKKFHILQNYYHQYGNLNISRYQVYNNYPIGDWIKQFKDAYKKHGNYVALTEEQIDMLNSINIVWSIKEQKEINNDIPESFKEHFRNQSLYYWNKLNKKDNQSNNDLFKQIKNIMIIIDKKNTKTKDIEIYEKSYDLYRHIFEQFGISKEEYLKACKNIDFNLERYIKKRIFDYNKKNLKDNSNYLFDIYYFSKSFNSSLVKNGYVSYEEFEYIKSQNFNIDKIFKEIHEINLSFFVGENIDDMVEDLSKYNLLDNKSIRKIYFEYPFRYKNYSFTYDDKTNNKVSFLLRSGSNFNDLPLDYIKEICKRNSISLSEQKRIASISNSYNNVIALLRNSKESKKIERVI